MTGTTEKQGNIDHILSTSRVVWDNVVAPGWLHDYGSPSWNCDVDVFRVAEAMFPLVGLACTRELRMCRECPDEAPHYEAIKAAAVAGSPSCVAWIIARTRTQIVGCRGGGRGRRECWLVHRMRTIKEAACVADGLCEAGNVEAARVMFGSGGGGEGTFPLSLWDGRAVPQWGWGCDSIANGNNNCCCCIGCGSVGSVGAGSTVDVVEQLRNELREFVRESCGHRNVLQSALGRGSVETVKWFVCAFGIGWNEAKWIFMSGLSAAALKGHIEVIKWVLGEFNLMERWTPAVLKSLAEEVLMGDAPSNIKWCIDNFQLKRCNLLSPLLSNKHGTVELCQWLKDGGWVSEEMPLFFLPRIKTFEIAKWFVSAVPYGEPPSVYTLNEMCKMLDVKFVEWLVTENHFIATASTFVCSCSTLGGECALPQWLSTRVELQPADLQLSLEKALCSGNIEIANWLESHFSVMESVNSCATAAERLAQMCLTQLGSKASKWCFQRLSPEIIESSIWNTLQQKGVKSFRCDTVIHLLEAFPGFMNQGVHTDLLEMLLSRFMNLSLAKLQKFVTLVDCSMITKDVAAKCLMSTEEYALRSSKSIKWAITHFSLESIHIKMGHNSLLYRLIVKSAKTNCALWLIDTFGITLNEVIEMFDHWLPLQWYLDFQLEQWKMLLHKFPTIDIDIIRQHFMPLVMSSPGTARLIVDKFGFTITELDVFFTTHIKGSNRTVPSRCSTTEAWLDSMLGREDPHETHQHLPARVAKG
ncbi:hypothetical protein Pelo_3580 [Pelomyxa schiedti]|nr:hypothetical protein Pelo_3580 [Pelomyxa schiedti]